VLLGMCRHIDVRACRLESEEVARLCVIEFLEELVVEYPPLHYPDLQA
jgi:hypothetical protein